MLQFCLSIFFSKKAKKSFLYCCLTMHIQRFICLYYIQYGYTHPRPHTHVSHMYVCQHPTYIDNLPAITCQSIFSHTKGKRKRKPSSTHASYNMSMCVCLCVYVCDVISTYRRYVDMYYITHRWCGGVVDQWYKS